MIDVYFFPGDILPRGNMHLPCASPAAPNLTHCKPGAQFLPSSAEQSPPRGTDDFFPRSW